MAGKALQSDHDEKQMLDWLHSQVCPTCMERAHSREGARHNGRALDTAQTVDIASKGTWHAPEPPAAMAATALAAHRAFAPATAPMASSAVPTLAALAPARSTALLARRAWLPSTTPSRRALLCRAADGEDQQQQQQSGAGPSPPGSGGGAGSSQEQPKRPAVEDPSIAKGQRTAIITGAISIIFGVRCVGAGCRPLPPLLLPLACRSPVVQ